MSQKIIVTKIIKQGFGRKINSEFGYSSFDVQPTSIEVVLDPPIDLTTEEGKAFYTKVNENLTKMAMRAFERDVEYYKSRNKELEMTLEKKKLLLAKLKGDE